jgi:hypothetical protein
MVSLELSCNEWRNRLERRPLTSGISVKKNDIGSYELQLHSKSPITRNCFNLSLSRIYNVFRHVAVCYEIGTSEITPLILQRIQNLLCSDSEQSEHVEAICSFYFQQHTL